MQALHDMPAALLQVHKIMWTVISVLADGTCAPSAKRRSSFSSYYAAEQWHPTQALHWNWRTSWTAWPQQLLSRPWTPHGASDLGSGT